MKVQKTAKKKKTASVLFWNKAKTKLAAKIGDNQVVFESFPEFINETFPVDKTKWLLTYHGSKLDFISPYSGVLKARFVGFVREEGKAPQPKEMNRSYNDATWIDKTAMAKFRLTAPKFNGMNITVFLTIGQKYPEYEREFVQADDNDKMYISVGKSTKAAFLVSFLEAIGLLDQEFPYAKNPLPLWHKAGRKVASKNEVKLVFEKGYVSKILPLDDFDESEEEAEDAFTEEEDFAEETEEETQDFEDELDGFDDDNDFS